MQIRIGSLVMWNKACGRVVSVATDCISMLNGQMSHAQSMTCPT